MAMIVMSGNWWPPQAESGGCAPPRSTPICTRGGYLSGLDVRIGDVRAGPGSQSLRVKADVFFPLGIPAAAPCTDGAQLLIEDLGAGAAAVFDVSRFTTPVPPAAASGCEAGDGWDATAARTICRNRSTALDPPVCTAGSARGLRQLHYKPKDATELAVQAMARGATIAAPVGPLRASLVIGSTQTVDDAGVRAIRTF